MKDYIWKLGSLSILFAIVGLGIWTVAQKNSSEETPAKNQAKADKDRFEPYEGSGSSKKRAEKDNGSTKSKSGKNKSDSEVVVLENTVAEEDNSEDLSPPPPRESDLAEEARKLAEERKQAGETTRKEKYERMKKVDETANVPFNPLKHVSFETLQRMMATNLDAHPLGGHSLEVNPHDMTAGRKASRPLPPPTDVDQLAKPKKTNSRPNPKNVGVQSITVGERSN